MVSDEQELDFGEGDGEDTPSDPLLILQKQQNLFKKVEKPKYGQGTPPNSKPPFSLRTKNS